MIFLREDILVIMVSIIMGSVYGDVGCGCWDIFFWGNCDGDLDDVYDFFEWCGLIWIKMKYVGMRCNYL